MTAEPLIEVSQLTKTYRMGDVDVRALRGVSLRIDTGEFIAIMGPSGSGKSTLMHVLGLLDTPDSGSFRLLGQEVSRLPEDEQAALRSRTVGFIFQQFNLLARTEAIDNVALPLQYVGGGASTRRAEELLRDVGLEDRMHHKPSELSGGQQQRVAIARSMVNRPKILFADEPTGNLDSLSEKEILDLLCRLHRDGLTLVVVTHEEEIGKLADRVIRMRDGQIVSDDHRKKDGESGGAGEREKPHSPRLPLSLSPALSTWSWHHLRSYFRQAWTALMANKIRSGLSMLGILIGVGAVIAMLALGRGAKKAMEEQLSSLGSNLLIVMPGSRKSGHVSSQQGAITRFTPEDGDVIKAQVRNVLDVNPTATGRGQIVYRNKNWNSQIVGVSPAYETMRGYTPATGRFFTALENRERARVAILGVKPWRELFAGASPIGEFVKINKVPFQIIGVFVEKGSSGWRDQDDVVVVPVQTAMRRLLGRTYLDYIDIQTRGPEVMDQVEEDIRRLVIQRLRLPPSQEDTFDVRNLAEIQAAISASSKIMSLLLSIVAAISLLVGGIGIMNIMLVSVTERTREIGLRKALGARRRDILAQFLIEAITTSLLGGGMGVMLGGSITLAMATLANWTVSISLTSVLVATLFSGGIGVIFGLWPARKASRLNPIEALRYE